MSSCGEARAPKKEVTQDTVEKILDTVAEVWSSWESQCEAQEENGLARLKEESCTGQTQEGLFPKPPKVGPRKCITYSRLCPRKCITYLRLFTYV